MECDVTLDVTFDTYNEAKEECTYNPLCKGIQQLYCSYNFYLCYVGSKMIDDNSNCYYERIGN